MNASIIFANPKMPYIGHGIFDLQPGTIPNAHNQLPVTLSTTGSDLVVSLTKAATDQLNNTHPQVYGRMKQGHFFFGLGALPFYISDDIRYALWGDASGTDYACITPQSAVSARLNSDGSSVITVSGIMHGNGFTAKAPGVILPKYGVLTTGKWRIGMDLYGNLCFTNGACTVMLGAISGFGWNGHNASWHSFSGVIDFSAVGLEPTKKIYNVGDWNIGVAPNSNLVFTNGCNRAIFSQNNLSGNIFIFMGYNMASTGTASPSLTVSGSFGKNKQINTGKWTIGEDTGGNLCFYNDLAKSGADNGIFFTGQPVNAYGSDPNQYLTGIFLHNINFILFG